ncbi:hypothetical protein [Streptomyces sp. NPDC057002]|uniref:hypothetical protein n=1 Tax=Streptomyces sp. NPDC057002 TaxID=3345992 RepID=UPI003639BD36
MPADDTSARPMAELLYSISQELHLDPACRAGVHEKCRYVDQFSGLTCCCPLCEHTALDGAPPPVTLPLLHLAEEGRPRNGYTYLEGECLGVRSNLYELMVRLLERNAHQPHRSRVAYELALGTALLFAPRG